MRMLWREYGGLVMVMVAYLLGRSRGESGPEFIWWVILPALGALSVLLLRGR